MENKAIRKINLVLFLSLTLGVVLVGLGSTLMAAVSSWRANVQVNDESAMMAEQDNPSLVASGSTLYVAWDDTRNGNADIYVAESSDDGQTWEANVRVNDHMAEQFAPSLAVGNSSLYVAWVDTRNGMDIYIANSTDGGQTWGAPVLVNDDTNSASQGDPSLAVGTDGTLYVAWMDTRGGDGDIYFAKSTDGGQMWSTNVLVNDDAGSATQSEPTLAVDADGTLSVAWEDKRNNNTDIFFAQSTDGGQTWSSNVRVNGDTGQANQLTPDIAVDNGKLYVMWRDQRNGQDDIYVAQSTDAGLTWGNVKVNDDGSLAGQTAPTLSVASDGTLYAAWMDSRNGIYDIYFAESSDSGQTWSSNERVDDDTNRRGQDVPSVALSSNGTIAIAWKDFRNGNPDIYASSMAGSVPVPTLTPTPLGLAPTLIDIRANYGRNDMSNDVNIYGDNFASNARVRLGDTELDMVAYMDRTHLLVKVPTDIAPNTYDLTVKNPDGNGSYLLGELPSAYSVYEAQNPSEDLFAFDYEFGAYPMAPHAGNKTDVVLIVHRRGGEQTKEVKVRFYEGDPDQGGTELGEGSMLLAGGTFTHTTSVAWTPPSAGEYTLFAMIDPTNQVSEAMEQNNRVSRKFSVMAPAADQTAPRVDGFTINNEAEHTDGLMVTLNATVSDPSPSSSVAEIRYLEYEYSQAAGIWFPVTDSEWLAYDSASNNYAWELMPGAGLKLLQAWSRDGAGNISVYPHTSYINYGPPTQRVDRNRARIYRYDLQAGQSLTAIVERISGDPDLYIWPPNFEEGDPPWVSNLDSNLHNNEQVTLVAPVSGMYQVEVYGFSSAEYRLTVSLSGNSEQQNPNNDRVALREPMVPVASQPMEMLPTMPQGEPQGEEDPHFLYLPTVIR
ncbi:MAG: exo-alpha-sialidase [Ardenticatenaceae bacterium]